MTQRECSQPFRGHAKELPDRLAREKIVPQNAIDVGEAA
jgi:hypothetical protein